MSRLHREDPVELRAVILRALESSGGNVVKAAQQFDLTRRALSWWLKKLGLQDVPARIRAAAASRFALPPWPGAGARHNGEA